MSEQAEELNKALRAGGLTIPPPVAPVESEDGDEIPDLPFIELPKEGWQLSSFSKEAGAIAKTNGMFRREDIPVTINKDRLEMVAMTADRFRPISKKIATCSSGKLAEKGSTEESSLHDER